MSPISPRASDSLCILVWYIKRAEKSPSPGCRAHQEVPQHTPRAAGALASFRSRLSHTLFVSTNPPQPSAAKPQRLVSLLQATACVASLEPCPVGALARPRARSPCSQRSSVVPLRGLPRSRTSAPLLGQTPCKQALAAAADARRFSPSRTAARRPRRARLQFATWWLREKQR